MTSLLQPSPADWIARKALATLVQQVWRNDATAMEDLYEQRWVMDGIPDGISITIPSTARAIVDEATDHTDFDPKWLRVHTPTYGLTDAAAERSSNIRAFIPGWLTYQIVQTNDVSPIRDYIKNMHITGKAVYKVFYDKENWPEADVAEDALEQDRQSSQEKVDADRAFLMPVVMRSISPLAVYEDPSVGQKKWAIEVYDRTAYEVQDMYEDWVPEYYSDTDADPTSTCQVWDCYQIGEDNGVSGLWHQVLVAEGTEGVSEATPAVFLPNEPFPYVIRFSGFGRQSSGRYEEKARGLLYAVRSLLYAEGRRLTQLDAIISALAWPTLFVNGPRSKVEVRYGPNIVNYVPAGVTAQTITPQIPSGPIQSALAVIQSGIERGTFGSVIRGDKPPQTTSAAQLAILSGQARLRFGTIQIHHEAAIVEVCTKALNIIKDCVQSPVTLWQWDDTDAATPNQLVIKPSDIPDNPVFHVEIMTDPVEEQERRAQLGVFLWEKGAIDWEEMAERSGVKDVVAMRRRIIRDKILFNSPAVIQALGERYLLESGYDIESLTLEKTMRDLMILRSQQQMQSAMTQAPGGAVGPGNAPAPPAGFSPNQLGGRPGSAATPQAVAAATGGGASPAAAGAATGPLRTNPRYTVAPYTLGGTQ